MTRIAFVACISLWALACNEPASFPFPSPTPQNSPTFSLPPTSPEPTPPITRTVSVGEVVSDRLASDCGSSAACAAVWQARFQLTAPTDGTLVVRVNWDPFYWDTYLKLRIGDRVVSSMEGIPLVGRLRVAAGQTYVFDLGFEAVGSEPVTDFTMAIALE